MAILETYREKRDFEITPEPAPAEAPRTGPLTFVIQKHAARRLHYDFRLEWDGVLKSWAVPKGPSLDPADKRLAVMVEDHPIDYAGFEGVIPKGQYGAGQVIIWDSGEYTPDEGGILSWDDREESEKRMRDGLAKGKLSITMRGQKLHGSWTLVKSKRSENEWLLIKHKDEFADTRDILEEDASIASGTTIADLKSAPPGPVPKEEKPSIDIDFASVPGAKKGPIPKNLSPMLPSLTERAFSHPDWLFEPKLDGVRVLAVVENGEARLMSRRGSSISSQYPGVAAELGRRSPETAVFDGEIVALDAEGRPSFHLLAHRIHLANPADVKMAETQIPVSYYIFDLIYLNGYDLRGVPLETRKELLAQAITPSTRITLVDHFAEVGEIAYEAVLDHGLEGIVGKTRRGTYEMGKRSRHWLKVKGTTTEDFVVGGYSEGTGDRSRTFGSLLVGNYDADGELHYAAHVGTGFDQRTLDDMLRRMQPLRVDERPFAERPPLMKTPVTWIRPELVIEVKFAQHTPDGSLRAPVFMGLRDDKPPSEAQILAPVPAPEAPPPKRSNGDANSLPPRGGGLGRDGVGSINSLPPRGGGLGRGGVPGQDLRGSGTDGTLEADIDRILDQLNERKASIVVTVQGERIGLTHLDKVLWPDAPGSPVTKREFIRHLTQAAPHILHHLRDRPLTLVRLPNGVGGQRFFQKHAEDRPAFVEMARYYSKHVADNQDYLMCNNLPTLLWLGQLAAVELHVSYSRVSLEPDGEGIPESAEGSTEGFRSSILNYPDFLVFDIDPYIYSGKENPGDEPELNREAFAQTCEAAFWIKETLDGLKLKPFVKTTGRTGLHIFVPIMRQYTYDAVRATSETIALHVLRQHPKELTTEWQVTKRTGKIFIDYNQGARMKTLAAIYSPRAVPEASVSVPLRWEELGKVYPTDFTVRTVADRIAAVGDLWADILASKHDLKSLIG